ncbi:MAG: cAMP-binding protein [Gemmatales bacterium]|nr:MAG: cAMP-binding protein [Gemmatales bacterium]
MDNKIWYIKRCSLFESLTTEQIERLEKRALIRKFAKRSFVYLPTEPGQSVLVVARGRIKIKDITPDGRETILAFIDEGELFGELAILDEPSSRQEYAEAVVDSEIVVVPREDLLWLMEQRPDIALSITKLVGLRRKRIENRLRNVLFLSSRDRMIRTLVELVETHGTINGQEAAIHLPLSHQEIASLIGVTRETVTIVLGQLQSEGLVRIQRRRIQILDFPRLQHESSLAEGARAPVPKMSRL